MDTPLHKRPKEGNNVVAAFILGMLTPVKLNERDRGKAPSGSEFVNASNPDDAAKRFTLFGDNKFSIACTGRVPAAAGINEPYAADRGIEAFVRVTEKRKYRAPRTCLVRQQSQRYFHRI